MKDNEDTWPVPHGADGASMGTTRSPRAMAVREAVLRRWAECGLVPTSGAAQVPPKVFTGFPPVHEVELPVVAVENVE